MSYLFLCIVLVPDMIHDQRVPVTQRRLSEVSCYLVCEGRIRRPLMEQRKGTPLYIWPPWPVHGILHVWIRCVCFFTRHMILVFFEVKIILFFWVPGSLSNQDRRYLPLQGLSPATDLLDFLSFIQCITDEEVVG